MRRLVFIVSTIAVGILGACDAARAAPRCMARILADVPAEEAPEEVKSKGSAEFGPITEIKVNKKTGRMIYCAHDTYCYNSNAFELVSPCRLKLDKDKNDSTFFMFFTR